MPAGVPKLPQKSETRKRQNLPLSGFLPIRPITSLDRIFLRLCFSDVATIAIFTLWPD
jgi:hypothetical protein